MNIQRILKTKPHQTIIVIFSIMLTAGVAPALAGDDRGAAKTVFHADIVTRMNPDGIMLMAGGYRRWSGPVDEKYGIPSTYSQLGLVAGVNPAYAQASAYGEWQPAIFARIRFQYDLYRFFGENGALLSFPSADAKFGKHEVDALKGREESGWGQRVMVQPIFTAKAGPVIIRNATDLAYYRFDGKGPYFYEWEYDTLLKNGDYLIDNATAFLLEAWKGAGSAMLLVGPFYEITNSGRADITRQRTGVQAFWSPAESIGSFRNPRIYGRLGANLQDRNRDNEMFLIAGLGFDF